jgi:hypothetical protein
MRQTYFQHQSIQYSYFRKYEIVLYDTLNEMDRLFLMKIIDLCAAKQTLSKQLELRLYDKRDKLTFNYNLS